MKTTLAVALAFVSATAAISRPARADDSAYYQQFLYTETSDADGNISTRFLMAQGFDVGTAPMGHVVGIASLFLVNDGSFVLKWSEMTDQGFPVDFGERFEGKWTVDDVLHIGDIATGKRAVFDGRNAVELTFLRDLHTVGLKGKTAIVDYGFSNERIGDPRQ